MRGALRSRFCRHAWRAVAENLAGRVDNILHRNCLMLRKKILTKLPKSRPTTIKGVLLQLNQQMRTGVDRATGHTSKSIVNEAASDDFRQD